MPTDVAISLTSFRTTSILLVFLLSPAAVIAARRYCRQWRLVGADGWRKQRGAGAGAGAMLHSGA